MTLFFYNLGLALTLLASAPWWLWKMATTHKYRQGLGERLGRVPERLRQGGKPMLWLHAVSVGEVLAVSRLIGELDQAFPEYRLVISTTTRTGQELARQRFGAERVFYCPLDLGWAVGAYLDALRPRMLILAETEFWPNLLSGCFRRGVPVAVVNARISDRSWPRYRRMRWLWKPFLNRLARVLAQSETDAARLRALGCAAEAVTVAGNLKFDVRAAEESEATRLLRAQGAGLRFVVAGSTLEGEEAALLEAWPRLLAADAQLAMVLAPRHPERFAQVAALLDRAGVAWVRRSQWALNSNSTDLQGIASHSTSASKRAENVSGHDLSRAGNSAPLTGALAPDCIHPSQVVLLDTIGELASVYALAAVAFVGGSVVAAGGHNPLEPAQFGVPIVMGPHYANFRAITEDLLTHKALRIADKPALAATLTELLMNGAEAEAMGARARQVFDAQAGATARCVQALRALLAGTPERERQP
jgi:3-deoxy-D-manno-octulosonic-acid transferase